MGEETGVTGKWKWDLTFPLGCLFRSIWWMDGRNCCLFTCWDGDGDPERGRILCLPKSVFLQENFLSEDLGLLL